MNKLRVGFCICGSFCTHKFALEQMEILAKEYSILPIVSEITASQDTRFGKAKEFLQKIEEITQSKIITSVADAEPIGPKNMTDIMLIAPCTGNTMAKLALGIVDNTVTMAAKSHIRNARPILIAPATNDALGGAAKNIGTLMNYKNYYFVPFKEDEPVKKPKSMIADFSKIPEALEKALKGEQMQPIVF